MFDKDGSYGRAIDFAKTFKPNTGFSNIYVFKEVDSNGNILDEKYGMNMLTDYGMQQFFSNQNTFPSNLYAGKGVTDFDKSSKVLVAKIPELKDAASVIDYNPAYDYPMYYASADQLGDDTGIITCVMKYKSFKFAENYPGLSVDISMTEYGIGSEIDSLWTHTWVYDSTGKKTFITKHVSVALEIDVYFCLSYYESLILGGYMNPVEGTNKWVPKDYTKDDATFNIITTMQCFMNRLQETEIGTFRNNNSRKTRSATHSYSAFADNNITYVSLMSTFQILEEAGQSDKAAHGYIDGFYFKNTGFLIMERQMLNTSESFETRLIPNNPWSHTNWTARLGVEDGMPITQMDISSVNLFNIKSKLPSREARWNIPIKYHNNKDHWYNETSFSEKFAMPIIYQNNGEYVKMYVFQNMRPDDPIEKLSILTNTIYATNKYWDVRFTGDLSETDPDKFWILITDQNNIPEKCKTARYWILIAPDLDIEVTRRSDVFYLKQNAADTDEGMLPSPFPIERGGHKVFDNYEYGWYIKNKTVYIPNRAAKYDFDTSSAASEVMTYKQWMLMFIDLPNGHYKYSDMTNAKTTNPEIIDKASPFSSSVNMMTKTYRTESQTGIICVQATDTNEAVIFDLRNSAFIEPSKKTNWLMSTCIYGTNKIAYISTTDTSPMIRVLNIDTKSEETYPVPTDVLSSLSDVSFMYGMNDYVWLTNGTTYSFYINLNIRTGNAWESCNLIEISKSNLPKIKITAVDECAIAYNYDLANTSSAVIFKYDYPEDTSTVGGTKISRQNSSGDYRAPTTMLLRYVNKTDSGAALMLIVIRQYLNQSTANGHTFETYDMGQFLYDGDTEEYHQYHSYIENPLIFGDYLIYDGKMSPLLNAMNIHIKGTTKTIGSLNRIKNVSGKSFNITCTNTPKFGTGSNNGLPPGIEN